MRATAFMTLLIWLLAGCAPTVQGAGIAKGVPSLQDDAAIMADGTRLPMRHWAARQPSAILIALHGFNDYSNAFAMPGPWWAERGISVYAYDQRGFGQAPHRGLWAGTPALVADLQTIVFLVRQRHPGMPVYILGESMGGAVTMVATAGRDIPVDGIILSAPAVWGWSELNPFYETALWVGAHTFPWSTATGQGLGIQASDNIDMLRDLGADPLVIKETRIDAVYGLVGLMEEAWQASPQVKPPVLLLYGRKDQVVPPAPIAEVRRRMTAELTSQDYEQGWHLLLRDVQRERVWNDVADWIAQRELTRTTGLR